MWQYSRSDNTNYYNKCGSTAVESHLIITPHVGVLPYYHIKLLLNMWHYCHSNTSNYYDTCSSTAAVSHQIITTHVAVLSQYHI